MSDFPYLVIDQNQLRKAEKVRAAVSRCRTEGLQILLPDGAGFELSKGSQVFDTWRNSCEFIRQDSDVIVVSRKMTTMIQVECLTGKPIDTPVDDHASGIFRNLLGQLADGDETTLRQLVDGPIQDKMPNSLCAWADSESHRQLIISMRDALRSSLSEGDVKRLRRSPDEELGNWLSSTNGTAFVYQGIHSHGASQESTLRLAALSSVTASYIAALAAIALYWLAAGGLETAKPEQVTNDLHDVEYAVLGSLSAGLLSADRRLQAIYSAVTSAQNSRIKELADQLDSF